MKRVIAKRVIVGSAGAIAAAALAAGCGSSGGSNGSSGGTSSSGGSSSASSAATGLHLQSTKYGQVLVDSSGRTLYMLTADAGSKSSCYGTCASIWPPDTTTGAPAVSGVTASMVGTSARTDNTTQVTFNGHPLYTFAQDAKSGDVNGEGVATFGGTWYVVGANGNPITSAPASQAPSTSGGGGGY
jgi:predicted lipoprotein with Yx(FWY)xxD motif